MRVLVPIILLALLPTLAPACASTRSAPDGPDRMLAAADDLDRRFVEAFSHGDLDGVMACYSRSPETVLQPPDTMIVRGWDAIRADYEAFFGSKPDVQLVLSDHRNRVEGDVVVGCGEWSLAAGEGANAPVIVRGRYLDVKGVRDGKWVYLYDCASVPMSSGE